MKKVFGIEAEVNITADEDICKGIGKGVSNGSILLADIIKEIKPEIIKGVKSYLKKITKSHKTTNKSKGGVMKGQKYNDDIKEKAIAMLTVNNSVSYVAKN